MSLEATNIQERGSRSSCQCKGASDNLRRFFTLPPANYAVAKLGRLLFFLCHSFSQMMRINSVRLVARKKKSKKKSRLARPTHCWLQVPILTLARDVMAIVTWILVMNRPIKHWHQPTKVGAILAKCDSSVHRDCGIRLICQLLLLALPLSVRRDPMQVQNSCKIPGKHA